MTIWARLLTFSLLTKRAATALEVVQDSKGTVLPVAIAS